MLGVLYLTVVVVAQDNPESHFWSMLLSILAPNFSVVSTENKKIITPPADGDLLLCDARSVSDLRCDTAVILYKDVVQLKTKIHAVREAVAVVDARKQELLTCVSETGLNAITCGLSTRDTITLSSIDVDSAVVNLQRSMSCFDGRVLEPQEIPLKLEGPVDNFALMAASAVYLLTGRKKQLANTLITN